MIYIDYIIYIHILHRKLLYNTNHKCDFEHNTGVKVGTVVGRVSSVEKHRELGNI